MNHWIVIFEDTPEMLAVRARLFSDHIAYLTARPEIFVDGTPLSREEGGAPEAGMWIVKSSNRSDIVTLIEGDPMYQSGHRSYRIFATGKVLSVT